MLKHRIKHLKASLPEFQFLKLIDNNTCNGATNENTKRIEMKKNQLPTKHKD